jgi:hypothetical protein
MAGLMPPEGSPGSPEFGGTVERLSREFGGDRARVERELMLALDRYRDARVTQFVMLLAERDVRRRMRRFQGDSVTPAVGHVVAELSRSVVRPKDQ